MFIQEVVIEGFKSYGQKTVVSNFDPQFNAITGLNGTGKSNILDAICFNLGITNLSQVRAGSMQDLIYKQGQAGITKASVTVTFNNADTANSPVGYESHKLITVSRQVMIGGKTKYSINGHTAQQNQVQNLFHSVQLNVNNPHFLIMQGRITKVLNMKPPEILSMIEEASGTRMYETKKEASLKILAKKQTKIDEIDAYMKNEITPALEKLQEDRIKYQKYQSNNIELERLDRFVLACKYKEAEEHVQSCDKDRIDMESSIQQLREVQTTEQRRIDEISKKISDIEDQRSGDMESDLQKYKKQESDLSKELVKYTTLANNQNDTLTNEKDNLSSLIKQLDAIVASIGQKQEELATQRDAVAVKEIEYVAAEKESTNSREAYQNAFAGIVTEENATVLSIPEQIATWEKKAREAGSQMQQIELRTNHTKETLKELKSSLKSQKTSYDSALKESQEYEKRVIDIRERIAAGSGQVDMKSEKALLSRASELKSSINNLRDLVDKMTASIEARLSFTFRDPEKGFDRSRVKGLVARLVKVTDKRASTALEIAAGAKLFQVVVDTEQTGKLLLQKGDLKKRVTILPLNKISSRCTDPEKVKRAKSIAADMRGSANLALELVGYDEDIRKAMEYTFGNVIICSTPDVAKAVAFDKNVRNRTVTFDGDSYDPSGTLTGGSKNQLGVLLTKIDELSTFSQQLHAQEKELAMINRQLTQIEEVELSLKDLKTQLDVAEHSYKLCQEKLNSTSYMQMQQEIDTFERNLLEYQKEGLEMNQSVKKAKDELLKLQSMEKNAKNSRENALKVMEANMKQAAKAATQAKTALTAAKSKLDKMEAEQEGLTAEKKSQMEQVSQAEQAVRRASEDLANLQKQQTSTKEKYEAAKLALSEKQAQLAECSKEIKQFSILREESARAMSTASADERKIQHKLNMWEKDFAAAKKVLTSLLKEHSWIEKERKYFGVRGTDFDFESHDIEKSVERHKRLKTEQEKLSKSLNKKVMGHIEKAEADFEDLRRKKEVILNDKTKIEAVIEELDVKKAQALQSTWVKVTRDFGSIFSMLLPGTQAKLEPPEGCALADGLEVKVAFNGVWKDSLTELSGGQRSLLALSLILALLLFKPAPMYILDEIDAALDLSHTQNIGLMLRTHFSKSQFIVVSLKEGMFNNANVIFRTKFVDGVSAVTRTVVGGRSKVAEIENDEENEPVRKKGKAKSKILSQHGEVDGTALEV